jgi:hypothetical protein
MPPTPRSKLAGRLVVSVALLGAASVHAARASAAQAAEECEQDIPAATDGRLTIDQPVVAPGGTILGLLSDFQQWPAGLIGGGSGETFLSCTPWAPTGDAEVMTLREAALFLVTVPSGTPPGEYPVSVLFFEGSQQPSGDGTQARLSGTVTVASSAPAGSSPVCALPAVPAPIGELLVDEPTIVGDALGLSLTGVPVPPGVEYFNEYDRLWYVACVGSTAVPIAGQDQAPGEFDVALPAGVPAGPVTVRILGVYEGALVVWERTVTVAQATTSTLPRTGLSPAGGASPVAVLLMVAGLLLVIAARTRNRGPLPGR